MLEIWALYTYIIINFSRNLLTVIFLQQEAFRFIFLTSRLVLKNIERVWPSSMQTHDSVHVRSFKGDPINVVGTTHSFLHTKLLHTPLWPRAQLSESPLFVSIENKTINAHASFTDKQVSSWCCENKNLPPISFYAAIRNICTQ